MSKIAMLAKLTAAEGKRDELVAALSGMVDEVQAETGTLVYALHTDDKDANAVWFYELYESDEALTAHSTSPVMKALGPKVAPLMGGRTELIRLTPVASKGL